MTEGRSASASFFSCRCKLTIRDMRYWCAEISPIQRSPKQVEWNMFPRGLGINVRRRSYLRQYGSLCLTLESLFWQQVREIMLSLPMFYFFLKHWPQARHSMKKTSRLESRIGQSHQLAIQLPHPWSIRWKGCCTRMGYPRRSSERVGMTKHVRALCPTNVGPPASPSLSTAPVAC